MDRLKTILIVLSICFLTYYYYKQYKNWKDEQSKLTGLENITDALIIGFMMVIIYVEMLII